MTLDERTEAAKKAAEYLERAINATTADLAVMAVKAFAPELFTSPPTMWLAPMEATQKALIGFDFAEDDTGASRDLWEAYAVWSKANQKTKPLAQFKAEVRAHLNREGK